MIQPTKEELEQELYNARQEIIRLCGVIEELQVNKDRAISILCAIAIIVLLVKVGVS